MPDIPVYNFYENIEPRYFRYLPNFLAFSNPLSEETLVIRLLLGTLKIEHISSGTIIDQTLNYSRIGVISNSPISTRVFRRLFNNPDKLRKLNKHLDETKHINKAFFKELLNEFSSYFYQTKKGAHTTAFLHLYRITEYISYSFPLIYASISREYYGTFDKLKNYFSNANSELKFFNSFVNVLFNDDTGDNLATIEMQSLNQDINKSHYLIIKKYLTDDDLDGGTPYSDITTYYKCLLKLTIDLRNRYFHFAMGKQKNIKSTEIIESDLFYQSVNSLVLNWISVIYFEILKQTMNKANV